MACVDSVNSNGNGGQGLLENAALHLARSLAALKPAPWEKVTARQQSFMIQQDQLHTH